MEFNSLIPFYRKISGARYVEFDDISGRLFVWSGGHGINIYGPNGIEEDYFMIGDQKENDARFEEVVFAIRSTIEERGRQKYR